MAVGLRAALRRHGHDPPVVCRGMQMLAAINPNPVRIRSSSGRKKTPDKPCDYKLLTRGLYRALSQIGIDAEQCHLTVPHAGRRYGRCGFQKIWPHRFQKFSPTPRRGRRAGAAGWLQRRQERPVLLGSQSAASSREAGNALRGVAGPVRSARFRAGENRISGWQLLQARIEGSTASQLRVIYSERRQTVNPRLTSPSDMICCLQ